MSELSPAAREALEKARTIEVGDPQHPTEHFFRAGMDFQLSEDAAMIDQSNIVEITDRWRASRCDAEQWEARAVSAERELAGALDALEHLAPEIHKAAEREDNPCIMCSRAVALLRNHGRLQ